MSITIGTRRPPSVDLIRAQAERVELASLLPRQAFERIQIVGNQDRGALPFETLTDQIQIEAGQDVRGRGVDVG